METLSRILVSWLPMLLLIGVWIYFMKKIRKPQDQTIIHVKEQNDILAKHASALERIATSLEKLSEKK